MSMPTKTTVTTVDQNNQAFHGAALSLGFLQTRWRPVKTVQTPSNCHMRLRLEHTVLLPF